MSPLAAERLGWRAHGRVFKFEARKLRRAGFYLGPAAGELREPTMDEILACGIEPYEVRDAGHNLLCNAGINRLEALLIAAGGQAYDHTHTAVGVGDGGGSVPTVAATDTDLAAAVNAANRYWQLADTSYPSAATQVVTVQATFPTGNANHAWNEWGIDQHTASGATASTAPLLNHRGIALGTKTSASAWTFQVTITIS